MWNKPTKKQLDLIPELYSTEKIPNKDKKIYMKFFMGPATWYIAEIDHSNYDTMYGFADLGDPEMAEWGYISLSELMRTRVGFMEVDRDLHGRISPRTPVKFSDLKRYD